MWPFFRILVKKNIIRHCHSNFVPYYWCEFLKLLFEPYFRGTWRRSSFGDAFFHSSCGKRSAFYRHGFHSFGKNRKKVALCLGIISISHRMLCFLFIEIWSRLYVKMDYDVFVIFIRFCYRTGSIFVYSWNISYERSGFLFFCF